jgi:hypothetical protein
MEIKFDLLFNEIEFPVFKFPNKIEIAFHNGSCAGVTLKNNPNDIGVIIVSLNKNDKFYLSGLRKGHVILVFNNILCNNHRYAIDIITYSQDTNSTLTINTLTKI